MHFVGKIPAFFGIIIIRFSIKKTVTETSMEIDSKEKVSRVLELYTRFINGALINKANEAERYHTSERSIQRDIEDIRNFLEKSDDNGGIVNTIIYDRVQKVKEFITVISL